MRSISENAQFRTFDSEYIDKKNLKNYPSFNKTIINSSEREISGVKNKDNDNLSFSITNKNTSFTQDINNISTLTLELKENCLYGNDFSLTLKPWNLGKTRVCLYIKYIPIISIGENILYPLLLIVCVCIIYIVIWFFFFNDSGTSLQKLFNYFFVIYLVSHLLSIYINPGIPSHKYHQIVKNDLKEKKINKFSCSKCKKCNLCYKLKDVVGHCNECNICYFGYDRHCFWIGHCIGKYNKLFFICFALSLFTFLLLCLTMIVVKVLKVFFIKQK